MQPLIVDEVLRSFSYQGRQCCVLRYLRFREESSSLAVPAAHLGSASFDMPHRLPKSAIMTVLIRQIFSIPHVGGYIPSWRE
jgi:hypothetical protein